jgi:hypothetical protein
MSDIEIAQRISEQRERLDRYRRYCLDILKRKDEADDAAGRDTYMEMLIHIEQALATIQIAEFMRYQS